MAKEIKYLEDKNVVLVTTSGIYELQADVDTVKEIKAQFEAHHCDRVLVDHRATQVIMKTMPAYNRADLYKRLGFDYSQKAALVFKELQDDILFYETVCRNQGVNLRVFVDYDEALDWLITGSA